MNSNQQIGSVAAGGVNDEPNKEKSHSEMTNKLNS